MDISVWCRPSTNNNLVNFLPKKQLGSDMVCLQGEPGVAKGEDNNNNNNNMYLISKIQRMIAVKHNWTYLLMLL